MKKVLLSVFALAALLFVASCEKEMEAPVETASVSRTFTCVFAQPDTKVAIANDGKATWEVGDQIMLHGGTDGHDRYLVTLAAENISNDGLNATFTVDGLAPYNRSDAGVVSEYYAQYPASAVPEGNLYYECRFNSTNHLLMAACNVGDTFVFYNLCGVIAYTVSGDFDKVVFSGNNGEAVAYDVYQVRVRDDGSGAYCNYWKPGNGSGTPVASESVDGTVVSDGVTKNYIGLPNGANFSAGFCFKFYKNGDIVKTATSSKPVDVAHGVVLNLGDITSHLEDYVAPTHQSSIENATDISGKQANCFVITAPGAYKFPAVKGNSHTAAGNVYGAEIVWETYNNAEEVTANSVIEAVDYEDNWIYFKTPDVLTPGNALIAALDASGAIIWSWHIWIPATAIEEVGSYSVDAKYLMDRNLGALKAAVAGNSVIDITSIGLYYQWGRKDPFVGPREILEGEYPSKAKVAGVERTAEKIQISLAESIAQPTLFARGLYVDGKQVNPDWCSDQNGEYWGDSGDKSVYDPCPAGYRIPKRDKNKLLWADSMSDYEFSTDYYWFKVGDPAVVFPAVGWIDGGSIKTSCRFGLWNAHHDSWGPTDPAEVTYGYNSYAAYARRFYVESGAAKLKNSSVYKSLGYNVRCESISKTVPDPALQGMKGATSVVLDGSFSDWTNADIVNTTSSRITAWKFGYDAENLYFYYKITKSKIGYNAESGDYAWQSYIYIGLDTDNDAETGARIGGGTDMETGGEVKVLIYPWRGNYNEDSLSVVNGVDGNGWVQCPVGSAVADAHATVYGIFDGDYCYLEVGIPKSALGDLSNYIAVAHAMDYSTTAKTVIPMN